MPALPPADARLAPAPAGHLPAAWDVLRHERVDSTNRVAAHLPAWTAVVAREQSAGRGRYPGRKWMSDRGGLWFSAVLPCPGPASRWTLLPLAAGLALLETLAPLQITDLHLRWPNDLLAGRRKLAGLLVERHSADTAVVGIGINLTNHPAAADPSLAPVATRLADLVPDRSALDADALLDRLLEALRREHAHLASGRALAVTSRLNHHWRTARPVAVSLHGTDTPVLGSFLGVDDRGALQLLTTDGPRSLDPLDVELLREL